MPECITSRAHNASFRHFNPPSKAAASFHGLASALFLGAGLAKRLGFTHLVLLGGGTDPLEVHGSFDGHLSYHSQN